MLLRSMDARRLKNLELTYARKSQFRRRNNFVRGSSNEPEKDRLETHGTARDKGHDRINMEWTAFADAIHRIHAQIWITLVSPLGVRDKGKKLLWDVVTYLWWPSREVNFGETLFLPFSFFFSLVYQDLGGECACKINIHCIPAYIKFWQPKE